MSAGGPSGADAGRLVRRWIARLSPPGCNPVEAVFLQEAGSAAPIAWLSWLPRAALLGLVILVVLWATTTT